MPQQQPGSPNTTTTTATTAAPPPPPPSSRPPLLPANQPTLSLAASPIKDLAKETLRPLQAMSSSSNIASHQHHHQHHHQQPASASASASPLKMAAAAPASNQALTATPTSASENLQRITGHAPTPPTSTTKSGPSKTALTHAQANAALQNSSNPIPTVYLATYSNVPVYEVTVRGIAVMRRREDGWLNATSILKIAGIEKTKRTKILEKNILTGQHEKIQGGYGKFQGTWIPLQRAQELAAEHNVAHILKPILEFDPSTADQLPKLYQRRKPNPANRNNSSSAINDGRSSETPNSKSYSPAPTAPQLGGPSQQPRFLSLRPPRDPVERDASPALFMPPGVGSLLNAFGTDTSSHSHSPLAIPPGSTKAEQDALRGYSTYGYTPQGVPLPQVTGLPHEPSATSSKRGASADGIDGADHEVGDAKRARVTSPGAGASANGTSTNALLGPSPVKDLNALGPSGGSLRAASAPRGNRMAVGAPNAAGRDGSVARYADRALPPKPYDEGERRMRDHLVSLFADDDLVKAKGGSASSTEPGSAAAAREPGASAPVDAAAAAAATANAASGAELESYESKLDALLAELREKASLGGLGSSGSEGPKACLDLVTDDHGHTALHWASALCRLALVQTLVARPPWNGGANVHAGNHAGETALHRSVLVTNSYDASSFPALLSLLSSSLNTRDFKKRTVLHHIALVAGLKGRAASARYYMACVLEHIANDPKYKGLVDAQDEDGETALGIVARLGNVSMIRMLLDVGARKDLPNALGIRAADWGIEGDAPDAAPTAAAMVRPSAGPVPKSSDVREQMSATLDELQAVFERELKEKNDAVATVQAHLQAATRDLAARRRNVSAAQARVAEKDEARQRVRNLRRALADLLNVNVDDAVIDQAAQEDKMDVDDGGEGDSFPTKLVAEAGEDEVEQLVRLRWLVQWHTASCDSLSERILNVEGASAHKESQCQQVVAMCANIPQDRVESVSWRAPLFLFLALLLTDVWVLVYRCWMTS